MLGKMLLKVLAVSVLLTGYALNAGQLDSVKESGVIKVAVPQDFAPFGFVAKDMSVQGYDIDMANYIAKELGVKVELVPVTSANRIPYLQTGKVDLIISSLGKNAAREKAIDFSNAYAPFFLGVFGSKDVAVSSVEDLADKVVGVTRGSIEDIELSKLVGSSTKIKRFEDNYTTISAYISGQVSLIATGNIIISEIASKYPVKAPVTKFSLKNSPCYIGMMKNQSEFMAVINGLINKSKESGALNAISIKWLKIPLTKDI